MVSSITSATSATSSASSTTSATSAEDMQNQFLTLLVAQLQNQDPTEPMDNSQLTSQMAQISTVSGIEKLNNTVTSVTSQFSQMQMLQGTSLIGHTVLTAGNSLAVTEDGQATAAFDLDSAASNATVTITNSAGELLDTVKLTGLSAGRNYISWDASNYSGDKTQLRYAVEAKTANSDVKVSPLAAANVVAATVSSGKLVLELSNGSNVDYSSVQSVF
jgi:flagellar basal-body rod modification protein FlgD